MQDNNFYENDYLPYIIRWGRRTNWTGLILCFCPALVLAFVYDLMPPATAILSGFVAIAGSVAVIWFVEPISYFPIIGVAGTYMAFISGNIANLRIPCAMVAQKMAKVEPGTNEGTIVATLGMAVSIVVNLTILTLGIVVGAQVLLQLPESVLAALQFLLPALFGAIFIQFAMAKLRLAPIVLLLCIGLALAVRAGIVPAFASTLSAVFLGITMAIFMYKKKLL